MKCMMLPKISGYRKRFGDINYMFCWLKMNNYLKMFNKYEIKSAVILKNDYRTVYKEKYLKSKI